MKNLFSLLLLAFVSLTAHAQDELLSQLKADIKAKKFDLIIKEHAEKVDTYPAKAIYYVAMAYYMKSDDDNALFLVDKSIEKDDTDADAHYIKGMTSNYMGQYAYGIKSFNKAIALDSTMSKYYTGLGDSYFSVKNKEMALWSYKKATMAKGSSDRPFTMIPQLYMDMDKPEKALTAYYKSREVISKKSESYLLTLFNIGLLELMDHEYDKAEVVLKELVEIDPKDYHSYAKLVQVFYGKKEYDKAEPYRQKLYDAHNQGLLKDNMEKMFCFDQFQSGDKHVQAFERFETKEGEMYYKHLFYVINEDDEIEYRIQTENSPVSVELGGPKYAIGISRENSHATYEFIEEDFLYDDLKEIVIGIIEGKRTPAASSTIGTAKKDKKKKKNRKGN